MTPSQEIAFVASGVIGAYTTLLAQEAQPLPYGVFQRYQSMVPRKEPDEILATRDCPYWWMYAEYLREYRALLQSVAFVPFREKRKK